MAPPVPGADPEQWATDVVIADGGVVRLRAYTPDDAAAVLALVARLSNESVHFRFFSQWRPKTEADLDRFLRVDNQSRVALVAELDTAIIGLGQYIWIPDRASAEVAFMVDERHHARGIGTILLEHLAAIAQANGIERFHANTLWDNKKMLSVFSRAGYPVHRTRDRGVWNIEFRLDQLSLDAVAERERAAEAASVQRVLAPGSVAVVGASPRRGSIGNIVFRNILEASFAGTVFPVHPTARSVAGVKAFPSLADVPDPVDLVVVAIPAAAVLGVVDEAGRIGAEAVVVISAGFAETGADGAQLEEDLVRIAHRHGMRLVGPNCVGVVNTAPGVSLNATFAPDRPRPGAIGFASQSGALGLAILDAAGNLGLGLSSFVSLGNKADVSGNDLLQFWEQDEGTDLALLYLESFGNPRKFARIAKRFSRSKPLVVVKGGRSEAGKRAASSHTAALASDDVLADTLFRQAGIIRVPTMEQLFDMARLLSQQPLPQGNRVAIIGNSGGPGILAADACVGAGLRVEEFGPQTQDALRAILPTGSAVANPIDLIASGSPYDYEAALGVILEDPAVDAVLAIFTDAAVVEPTAIADALSRAASRPAAAAKPLAASFLSGGVGSTIPVVGPDAKRTIPVFPFPEAPAIALGRAAALTAWRQRQDGVVPDLAGVDVARARSIASRVVAAEPDGLWLPQETLADLLETVGIDIVRPRLADSAAEAEDIARELDGPVALKVASDDIQHKTDVGGVVLDVASDEVAAAYRAMADRLAGRMDGIYVQPMIESGVEVIIGAVDDPSFGPVVMFGLGGTATELFADRAFSIVPVTDVDAAEVIRSPKSAALLFGHRGAAPADVDALEDIVLRVSRLAVAVPELAELDLNPVIARPDGAYIVDARARVAPVHEPYPRPMRRLGA